MTLACSISSSYIAPDSGARKRSRMVLLSLVKSTSSRITTFVKLNDYYGSHQTWTTVPFNSSLASPWTNSVTLLESSVSPLLKVALHWMLVLLYSTDMLLRTSIPCLVSSLNSVSTLVRLRSSSRVPFISHWTLVTTSDVDPQLYVGLSPEGRILMLKVSITRRNTYPLTHS